MCFGLSVFPSSSRRGVGCNRWRLHWGFARELGHSISVYVCDDCVLCIIDSCMFELLMLLIGKDKYVFCQICGVELKCYACFSDSLLFDMSGF